MANFVSRRRFTIEWAHCDPAGIVFNGRFFEFFDWGTWILFEAALGVKPPDLAGVFQILGIPLVDASARFLAPARFGDTVELASQAARLACGRSVIQPIPPSSRRSRFRTKSLNVSAGNDRANGISL
jgi:acyl-CoA thioesterase FadM